VSGHGLESDSYEFLKSNPVSTHRSVIVSFRVAGDAGPGKSILR
jgi:hypothetical protein